MTLAPIGDEPPFHDGLIDPALVLQKEGRSVATAEALGIERIAPRPLFECFVHAALASQRLAEQVRQLGVVRGQRETGTCDVVGFSEAVRHEIRRCQVAVGLQVRGRGLQLLSVQVDRLLRLRKAAEADMSWSLGLAQSGSRSIARR